MSPCHTTSRGGENRRVPAEGKGHRPGSTRGVDFCWGDKQHGATSSVQQSVVLGLGSIRVHVESHFVCFCLPGKPPEESQQWSVSTAERYQRYDGPVWPCWPLPAVDIKLISPSTHQITFGTMCLLPQASLQGRRYIIAPTQGCWTSRHLTILSCLLKLENTAVGDVGVNLHPF